MATIDTLQPINLIGTSATFQFEVIDDGLADADREWVASFKYKTHSSDSWTSTGEISSEGEGIYQQTVTGLYPNTLYDVTCEITNYAGTSYGDVESFWIDVQVESPTISTLPANNVTSNSGELALFVHDDGDITIEASVHTRFIYWSDDGVEKTTSWDLTTEGQQSSATIDGLEPGTVYWFYAKAMNSVGQSKGDTLSFKTLPDPNIPPIAFDFNEPNTLLIQNFINTIQTDPNDPYLNQGIITYVEKAGNLATLDYNDMLYSLPGASKASKIVSLIPEIKENGTLAGFLELSKDVRPCSIDANDSNNTALLELSIFSNGNPDSVTTSENSLWFWLPDDTNSVVLKNSFDGKPLTLQQISSDPNEPNLVYPVWDIRSIIEKNGRKLALNKLVKQKANMPYTFFEFSTTKDLLDINEDNIIDSNDYSLLMEDFGKTGIFRSDIASIKGFGLPDGRVDVNDEIIFITEYNERYPDEPIPNPYVEFSEGFENGNIENPFTSHGDAQWIIDSNPCSGIYCVKSGQIGNNQVSILEAELNTTSGKISFCCKVSCQPEDDNLTFYIDDIEAGRWSGQMDWEKVGFQTSPGLHNFKWIYNKDEFLSNGEDAAWIDNIEITLY